MSKRQRPVLTIMMAAIKKLVKNSDINLHCLHSEAWVLGKQLPCIHECWIDAASPLGHSWWPSGYGGYAELSELNETFSTPAILPHVAQYPPEPQESPGAGNCQQLLCETTASLPHLVD